MQTKELWINSDNYKQYFLEMANYSIGCNLSNYGYDYKEFRNMSNKKSRLNKLARILTQENAKKAEYAGIYSRFYFPENAKHIQYCTGQSQNEEMITVLECLTDTYKNN